MLLGGSLLLGNWVNLAPVAMCGLLLVTLSLTGEEVLPSSRQGPKPARRVMVAWLGTILFFAGLLIENSRASPWDGYYALIVSLVALAAIVTCFTPGPGNRARLQPLVLVWSFSADFIWIAASYLKNAQWSFFAGLILAVTCLIVLKAWVRLRYVAHQIVNTLIILMIGLPVVDVLLSTSDHLGKPPPPESRAYSFESASRDYAAFARWCEYFESQSRQLYAAIFRSDPAAFLRFQLKPGARGTFFGEPISINQNGFRGKEISHEKGGAYRIVVMGESTTFGLPVQHGQRPWPEQLEELIRDRLHGPRPVEIINAGIPSCNLKENIWLLQHEILPLKPDLIISYHGYNGFDMLSSRLPPPRGRTPLYVRRPLKLLADCEYRLKIFAYKRRQTAAARREAPSFSDPLHTEYAAQYRALIDIARSNHVALAVSTFSMAVNERSNPEVIEFYGARYPLLDWQIKANAALSSIVAELAREHPEVLLVDTVPVLDGRHKNFIDLVHFTPEGDAAMAHIFFSGIRDFLQTELAKPL